MDWNKLKASSKKWECRLISGMHYKSRPKEDTGSENSLIMCIRFAAPIDALQIHSVIGGRLKDTQAQPQAFKIHTLYCFFRVLFTCFLCFTIYFLSSRYGKLEDTPSQEGNWIDIKSLLEVFQCSVAYVRHSASFRCRFFKAKNSYENNF